MIRLYRRNAPNRKKSGSRPAEVCMVMALRGGLCGWWMGEVASIEGRVVHFDSC